ncbi:MAG TPA: nitrite reductase (NAD(P)H) small subunit [Rhizobium sp.]|nr:nitrite reductase (NAD(P)H) small subunit [Rhizobium sp.]
MSDEFIPVARTPDIGPGSIKEVAVHGRHVGLTNVGQTYYAFDASCPVDGTNLARDGLLKGDVITCPADEAAFDVTTGDRVDGGHEALQRYAIKVEENEVKIGPPLGE